MLPFKMHKIEEDEKEKERRRKIACEKRDYIKSKQCIKSINNKEHKCDTKSSDIVRTIQFHVN